MIGDIAAVAAVSVRSGGAHGDRLPPILRLHRVWHRAALRVAQEVRRVDGGRLPGRAAAVMERYGLRSKLSSSVLEVIGRHSEESWSEPVGLRLHTRVAADNGSAVDALIARGVELGLDLRKAPRGVEGEARDAGLAFQREALAAGGDGYVSGGECTVTLRGSGRGGRAQEFALSAATAMAHGLIAALGTDGIDGTSDAAGALVDEQVRAAFSSKFAPHSYLDHNDSDAFFARVGTQLMTGRTGTNVSDLYLYLR